MEKEKIRPDIRIETYGTKCVLILNGIDLSHGLKRLHYMHQANSFPVINVETATNIPEFKHVDIEFLMPSKQEKPDLLIDVMGKSTHANFQGYEIGHSCACIDFNYVIGETPILRFDHDISSQWEGLS